MHKDKPMFYTYILRSLSHPEQRYIGSTADLKSRLAKHNAGKVPHTSKFKPWKGATLPEQYRDHALTGNYSDFRECHIKPDWLLIYSLSNDTLILTLSRTGFHSNLFS